MATQTWEVMCTDNTIIDLDIYQYMMTIKKRVRATPPTFVDDTHVKDQVHRPHSIR